MATSPVDQNIVGGQGRYTPPSDTLRDVFATDVLRRWRAQAASSEDLRFRLRVLDASGPCPTDTLAAREMWFCRAWKAAWETYLYTAFACGMFEGDKGKDLRGRLRSADPDGFRSAMAECLACWFLAGRMGMPLDPMAPGRDAHNLEMSLLLDDGPVGVEVKAPFREAPAPPPGKNTVSWFGDDADKIDQCMATANKQFANDRPNLLVVIPRLRTPVFSHRHNLVKAAYGQSKITFPVDTQTGQGGPVEVKFFPDGKFLETRRPGGGPLKPDGLPGYRRISAIICIEERMREQHPLPKWIDHDVLVLHNPYAYHPLPSESWNEFPQLVPVGHEMKWTDGYPMDV